MFRSFEDAFNGLADSKTHRKAAWLLQAHAARWDVNADLPIASLMLEAVIYLHRERHDCGGEVQCGQDLVDRIEAMQSFLQFRIFAGETWDPAIDCEKWEKAVWAKSAKDLAASR
jgi:hypothetical protein